MVARVVAELRPSDPRLADDEAAAGAGATLAAAHGPGSSPTAAALAALAPSASSTGRHAPTAEQAERAFQALTASNDTLTKAIEKWRIAGEASADAAGQDGFRPLVLAVPFGEQALNPARLESVGTLVAQLERAAISGVVRIESFAAASALPSAGHDGYTLAAPTAPASQCDQVGNPFDDSRRAPHASRSRSPTSRSVRQRTRRRDRARADLRASRPDGRRLSRRSSRRRRGSGTPPPRPTTASRSASSSDEAGEFRPPAWIANRHLQSILPSLPLRRPMVERRARRYAQRAGRWFSTAGTACGSWACTLRLLPAPRPWPPRLAVLLHGWEGSADSIYLLSLANSSTSAAFGVRLNLRDHGGTHSLNRDLFHSCRLPEVVGAVARLQSLFPGHRLLARGLLARRPTSACASARARRRHGIRLARIVAVCPVLDPAATLEALELGPAVYRNYFLHKWRRSLRLKQAAWPGAYDFGDLIRDRSLTAMTEKHGAEVHGLPGPCDLSRGYAVTGALLESLEAPAHLLIVRGRPDDPHQDLARLARPASLERHRHAPRRALRLHR